MPTIKEATDKVEKYLGVDKKKPEGTEWLKEYLNELKESSATKQMAVGAGGGFLSGFVFGKFGKTAATTIGGTILVLHFAQQYGYIRINWNQVGKDVDQAKKDLAKKAEKQLPLMAQQVQAFIFDNILLAGGFGGGFLLGLASS